MSGTRQHFLPRFLLKGFGSTVQGDSIRTWVFRRARPPFETNIINIGTESQFYTAGGNTELDGLITRLENDFAPLIDKFRGYTSDTEVLDPELPEFITHLLTRTKYLRDSLCSSAAYFADALLAALSQSDLLERLILNHIGRHPEEILKDLQSGSKGYHLNKHQTAALMNSIRKLAPALLRQQQPELMAYVNFFKVSFREKLPGLIKASHIKSLRRNLLPETRVKFARDLTWFLTVRDKASFVLGDVGVVWKIGPEGRLKPMPDLDDDVREVWLPISDSQLVLGAKTKETPTADIDEINVGTASLSHEFFISSTNSEREKKLAEALGTKAGLIPENELERVVGELIAEFTG